MFPLFNTTVTAMWPLHFNFFNKIIFIAFCIHILSKCNIGNAKYTHRFNFHSNYEGKRVRGSRDINKRTYLI